jgi:hypothetical protein
MIAATDLTGVIVCAWGVGVVGVLAGLWITLTGRVRLLRGQPVVQGTYVRLFGLACAAAAAAFAWYVLTTPIVRQQ